MQIVLYMLKAWLGASRTHLSRHLLNKPLLGPVLSLGPGNLAGVSSDSEREELKAALIATQESAVVQIVLEICLETSEDVRHCSPLYSVLQLLPVITFAPHSYPI